MPREEAFARIRAACDARDKGVDIFILARTDSLILGWDEAIYRANEFRRIGADAVFIEALPDRLAMKRAIEEIKMPMMANSKSAFRRPECKRLTSLSHRGRLDRESLCFRIGRTRVQCCCIPVHACGSEAKEYSGNTAGTQGQYANRASSLDSFCRGSM